MADIHVSPDAQAVLLHHSTTGGITWRVLLRPELRRAGESEVVEFQKLGRKGKLLDKVIGWGGGSWRSEPSRKVPQWLRSEIMVLLCARSTQRAAEAASGIVELQHDHNHPLSQGLDRQRGSRQAQQAGHPVVHRLTPRRRDAAQALEPLDAHQLQLAVVAGVVLEEVAPPAASEGFRAG